MKTYRFGIVGLGMIAEFHAQAIRAMSNAKLHSVFSRDNEKAKAFSGKYDCKPFSSMEDFLADEELDIVTICTPSGAHMDPCIAAAEAKKHLIVEKPLDVTVEKVDQMIAACKKNNVQLVGVLPRRFNDSTRILKAAIEEGRFGKIVMADAYIKWWRTQDYYDSGAWRGTWALDGGGAIMNQSIHTIDLLLHLMGDVKSVCAFMGLEAHTGIEVEDVAVAILEFENGARGVIQGSTACWSSKGHPAQVQICGNQGSVFMVDDKFSVWDFKEGREEDQKILETYGFSTESKGAGAANPSAIDFSWHQKNFEEAVAAINEGRPSMVDGHEGRRAVKLIEGIYRSAKNNGQRVDLS